MNIKSKAKPTITEIYVATFEMPEAKNCPKQKGFLTAESAKAYVIEFLKTEVPDFVSDEIDELISDLEKSYAENSKAFCVEWLDTVLRDNYISVVAVEVE